MGFDFSMGASDHVSVGRDALKRFIGVARKIVPQRNIMEILKTVHVQCSGTVGYMSVTDSYNFLTLPVKGSGDFDVCVDFKGFCDLVAGASSDEITLEYSDGELRLTAFGAPQGSVSTIPGDDFPPNLCKKLYSEESVHVVPKELGSALSRLSSLCVDDSRYPALAHVLASASDGLGFRCGGPFLMGTAGTIVREGSVVLPNVVASFLKDGGTLYMDGKNFGVFANGMTLDGKVGVSPYPFPNLPNYVDGVDVDVQWLSSLLKALPVDCDRALLRFSEAGVSLTWEGEISPEEAAMDNGPVWLSKELLGELLGLVAAYPTVRVCTAGATRATQWTVGNLSFVLMPMHPKK